MCEIIEYLENTDNSVFLTGKAGTGKSTLIKKFIKETKKNIAILAPTGIAAINIGGQTIHSFFEFGKKDKRNTNIIDNIDTIVIDEISMVRSDLLDDVNRLLMNIRGNDYLFGGVQMIFVGDLFQLPPVVKNPMPSKYPSEFFFDAICMKKFRYKFIELTHIFRQNESEYKFKEVLNEIREKTNNIDFDYLNNMCLNNHSDFAVCLCAYKHTANEINALKLNSIKGDFFDLHSEKWGDFSPSEYPCQDVIRIKKGAAVIMTNNDKEGKWANGTVGVVSGYYEGIGLVISIDGMTQIVRKHTWKKYDLDIDSNLHITRQIVGEFSQYPIEIAYAMTIHKSQGKTFDNIEIDLGKGAFAHGQTYVALSRAKSIKGINLKKPIRYSDIIVNDKIINYYNTHRIQL